ncbi:hypothetical protein M3Y94_00089700 [Aphelenchoides besseyi]|nr:hypothetical protein M3Y94_00089700 [Aphelenchoides besseyi]KAI6237701.1 hypothetical protein M3Y95_00292900 [Aphelenchoides besseyi]
MRSSLLLLFCFFNFASSERKDLLSCGGRVYHVRFIPERPNASNIENAEYEYIPLVRLLDHKQDACDLRSTAYHKNNRIIDGIRKYSTGLIVTYCPECSKCGEMSHIHLHRYLTHVARDANLSSMLVLVPKVVVDGKNIETTEVKYVQMFSRYILSRTCALKKPSRPNSANAEALNLIHIVNVAFFMFLVAF